MGTALPKVKPRPYRRGVPRVPKREEALSPGLKKALIATACAFIILCFGQVIVGKLANRKIYIKESYSKTQKVLQEENAFLKGQLSVLLSPTNVEKIAKSKNMNRPTTEYHLRIGER
jgi:hypothetical protein